MGTTRDEAAKSFKVKVATKQVEGERTITAVVSSSKMDRDYEYVDVPSLRLPLKGGGYVRANELTGNEKIDLPMLLNHSFDVEDVIGSVRKAYLNESQELVVDFGISNRAKAQDLMTLIDEGHLDNAFSITMTDYDYDNMTIKNAEIIEISLVFRGSNKDARVLAVKSLHKESEMSDVEQTKDVEQTPVEAPVVETVEAVETPVEVVEAPVEEAEAPEEEALAESEEVAEVETPAVETEVETKSIKKETKEMSDVKDIAVKQIVPAVEAPTQEVIAEKSMSKNDARRLMGKTFDAIRRQDKEAVKALSDEMAKTKVIDGTTGAPLFGVEVFSQDILAEYENIGAIAPLVTNVDIEGAEIYRQLVETSGVGFQPVALGGTKGIDQPVWTPVTFEPFEWAVIVAWLDGVVARSPLAVYNQIVKYVAKEYAKLQDKIVLSYAGGTVGSETRPATGLVPILTTASRVIPVTSYDSGDVVLAIGEAYGDVQTDGNLTIVASRKTWGRLATAIDADGRPLFTVVGSQVSAGALGTFNVVISQEIADDLAVVGHFPDYLLVNRGGLETLLSREATIGTGDDTLNLFTSDASALRADVNITGGPLRVESFVLLDFPTAS